MVSSLISKPNQIFFHWGDVPVSSDSLPTSWYSLDLEMSAAFYPFISVKLTHPLQDAIDSAASRPCPFIRTREKYGKASTIKWNNPYLGLHLDQSQSISCKSDTILLSNQVTSQETLVSPRHTHAILNTPMPSSTSLIHWAIAHLRLWWRPAP